MCIDSSSGNNGSLFGLDAVLLILCSCGAILWESKLMQKYFVQRSIYYPLSEKSGLLF